MKRVGIAELRGGRSPEGGWLLIEEKGDAWVRGNSYLPLSCPQTDLIGGEDPTLHVLADSKSTLVPEIKP